VLPPYCCGVIRLVSFALHGDLTRAEQNSTLGSLLRPSLWTLDINQWPQRSLVLHSNGHKGELGMSDLVVIAFPTEAKAEEVRQKLLAMQKEYLIELGDA